MKYSEVGSKAVNAYGQEVEIKDITDSEVVVNYIYADHVDVFDLEDFEEHFKIIAPKSDEPSVHILNKEIK